MDEDFVTRIVDTHNYYRNEIASGRIGRYPTASRMEEMLWDEDLEFLAVEHVKHCNFEHDGCRATPNYPHAGQNLGLHATTGHLESLENITNFIIWEWFAENTLVNETVVHKFEESDISAGHFTVLIREGNNRVGCAMITYNYQQYNHVWNAAMITCVYAKTNILNWPIYTVGPPTADCNKISKTTSKKYAALCAP